MSQPTIHQGNKSIVDNVARKFIVPVALALDGMATLIRIADTTVQLTLPNVYTGWEAHKDGLTNVLYYTSAFIVISAISLGITAALFLLNPLMYVVNNRIETANHISNKKTKLERLKMLGAKKQRYQNYNKMAIGPVLAFGISYFLSQRIPGNGIIQALTAAADIAAPLIILFVIAQTEREMNSNDAQESTMAESQHIVMTNVRRVGQSSTDGTLTAQQATMLKRGMDGDVGGMVDATVPIDTQERMYTISQICAKLDAGRGIITTDRDDPNRRRISRIVSKSQAGGDYDIIKDAKRGWLVPAKLIDKLFGDYIPTKLAIRLVSDVRWTKTTDQPAPEAV